jgi:amidase
MEVLLYEFKADLNATSASRPGTRVRSLADVIAFNSRERGARDCGSSVRTCSRGREERAADDPRVPDQPCQLSAMGGPEGIDAVMEKHRLDAVVAPMTSPAWPTDHLNGDHVLGSSSTIAAVAGYPHVVGARRRVSGLASGLLFFGRAWSKRRSSGGVCLRAGHAPRRRAAVRSRTGPPEQAATTV